MITEQQYQRLMKTQQDPRNVRKAAMKAGMHRHTATKYLRQGRLPNASARLPSITGILPFIMLLKP